MELVFAEVKGAGVLDYVSAWYIKAAKYMQNHLQTKAAFVSTNSISQGEQVSILWNELFNKYKIKIHFAHRTFRWRNEARGNAAVHVVIIGFANFDMNEKNIYEYNDVSGEPHRSKAKNINPYLVEGKDLFVQNRRTPICKVPEMNYGSMPIDEGYLVVSDEEYSNLKIKEPDAIKFIKPYVGGEEFINAKKRWCIWLKDKNPSEYRRVKFIADRIQLTKKFREESGREATKKLSSFPGLFGEIRQPKTKYLLVPKVSSENRRYIPIGILNSNIIASGSALLMPNADSYSLGIMTSLMHMTWMRYVCGRLESRYQYSASIVYNNFPWPENPTAKQKEAVEKAAQAVLDARARYPKSSLADLYDTNTMPPVLVKAHQQLDKAVDLCYRSQPFPNETKRIEFLFELYDKYTAGLFVKEKKIKAKAKKI